MKKIITFVVCMSLLFIAEQALAGPGGKIASAAFETFWGRVALGGLVIVFLPLIIYSMVTEWLAGRRAMKDLRFMAGHSDAFDWLRIRERAKDCFTRVHAGWEDEDLSDAAEWMTDWYWQNQQLTALDKWKKAGLVNICEVKKITNIKPLLFVHRNKGAEHEDSMIAISIEAKMTDYLENRATGEVVEGSKNLKEVERVWTFTLQNGEWVVSDIEEGNMSTAIAKLAKDLPPIESTVAAKSRA
jgi:hypothetical protein